MKTEIHEYEGEGVVVRWDKARCIHAAECVRGLPSVFAAGRRPWVQPNQATTAEVLVVVARCPTGALQAERRDGAPAEEVPGVNTVEIRPDGPLYLRGDIAIIDAAGEEVARATRLALCRCGASENKPFCDGSHSRVGFTDGGGVETVKLRQDDALTATGLRLVLRPNGPVLVEGPVRVVTAAGETACEGNRGALCRCGASATKPFCDGTHNKIGFEAPG
ncbi:MAG TPA: CDGSH iron-sulfur domain-containing protein [Thermoanaerobaculia bacterium]|nr:CDGSH iron-sulfur domain-containing protein [Thermoanaerobaculia bacterium]